MGLFNFLSKKPKIHQLEPEIQCFKEGKTKFEMGQFYGKMSNFCKSFELKLNDNFALGDQIFPLANFTEAVEFFDKAIAIKPDYAGAWFYRGLALLELRRRGEGISDSHKVNSNGKEVFIVKREWLSEALESFDKAIAIKPDCTNAWFYRGLTLGYQWFNSKAVESFDKAIAIQPDFTDAWFYRGIVLTRLGKYSEAVESYDKVIAINPNSEEANQSRKELLNLVAR